MCVCMCVCVFVFVFVFAYEQVFSRTVGYCGYQEIWTSTMGPQHSKTLETAFSGWLADPAVCIN